MTRFQILKGQIPQKIDWVPDNDFFDRLVAEKDQELKVRFIATDTVFRPPQHWLVNSERPPSKGLLGTHNGVTVYWCHICGGYGQVERNGVTTTCPHCKGDLFEPEDD